MPMTNQEIRNTLEDAFLLVADHIRIWGSITNPTSADTDILLSATQKLTDMADLLLTHSYLEDSEVITVDSDEVTSYETNPDMNELYQLTLRGCDAGGYYNDDGSFVVFANSIACPDTTRRFATRHPGSFALRQQLIEDGLIVEIPETGMYLVTKDLWFETGARAASILSGTICQTNAWQPIPELEAI